MIEVPPRRLVLARHAQTEANQRHALDSVPPGGPLTAEGRDQAEQLAAGLAAEPVVGVYASTAIRAQQTAHPVAVRHGLSVEVIDGIHEVFVGELEGRTDAAALQLFVEVFRRWAAGDLAAPMPGGESAAEAIDRYQRAVRKLTARHPTGSVVIVSHGAAIRLVAPTISDGFDPDLAEHTLLPNTGMVVLQEDPTAPRSWRCVEWAGIRVSGG